MGTLRAKVLAAFLAGILFTLGALTVRNFVTMVMFRFDRIEQYLSRQEMMKQFGAQPQIHRERSHKGEVSQPQQWKV